MKKETLFRFRLSIVVILLAAVSFFSCTKVDVDKPSPPTDSTSKIDQPLKFLITSVFGKEKYIGLLINDPIGHTQYGAFGPKDKNGELDSIRFIIERDTKTGGWLSHELNEDYTPKTTTTSTGHTIEYQGFDPVTKKGRVTIKETSTGKTIHQSDDLLLQEDLWGIVEMMEEKQKKRGPFPPGWQAEVVYFATAGFGCIMGAAALSTGNPIALGWGLYNTYQNCKSAAEAAQNIFSGKPAFGCISANDNLNALVGFQETLSQSIGDIKGLATGIIPAVMNYVAQDAVAGKCPRDDDPPHDPFGNGGGHGDPHIFTFDRLNYDFHGYGEFIAAKSLTDNFEVQVRQEHWLSIQGNATVNTAVAMQTGSDIISLTAGNQKLYINNVLHDLDFDFIYLKDGASITKVYERSYPVMRIRNKNGDELKVRLDKNYKGPYLDYSVHLQNNRAGKVKGFLGNYDGQKENDLQRSDGTVIENIFAQLYPAFADSWRISQTASLFYYESGKNTESFTVKNFPNSPITISEEKKLWAESICKSAGVKGQPALSNCIFDVATTGDVSMAETAGWQMEEHAGEDLPTDVTNIEMQGDAVLINNSVRLTQAKSYISGQAFYKNKLSGDFETSFGMRIPYSANGGGDGIALVITKDIPVLINNVYPGSAGKLGYQGKKSSLAIEFDTWTDGDENSNHVAIHTKGIDANSTRIDGRVAANEKIPELQDGLLHKVKIRYAGQQLTVWLDDSLILEYAVDLFVKLGLDDSFYIGLASSTSGSFEEHFISGWTIENL